MRKTRRGQKWGEGMEEGRGGGSQMVPSPGPLERKTGKEQNRRKEKVGKRGWSTKESQ